MIRKRFSEGRVCLGNKSVPFCQSQVFGSNIGPHCKYCRSLWIAENLLVEHSTHMKESLLKNQESERKVEELQRKLHGQDSRTA